MQADFHSPRRAYWKKRRHLTFGRVLSQLCPVFSRVLLQCKLTNLQKENHLCWSTSPPGALGKWPLYCGSSMCLTAVKSTSTPSSYAHQLCRRAVSTILIHPHSGFRRGRKMKTHYDRNAYKHESIIRNVNIFLQGTGVIIPCRTWNNFLTSSQKATSQIWHQQEEPHCSPSASRGRLKELKMWVTLPATLCVGILPSKSTVITHCWFNGHCSGSHGHSSSNVQLSNEVKEKEEKLRAELYGSAGFHSPESTWQVPQRQSHVPSCAFLNGTEYYAAAVCLTWSKCDETTACHGASVPNKRWNCSSGWVQLIMHH